MPASEIDDIFSGKISRTSDTSSKAKGKAKVINGSTETPTTSSSTKKKKSKKRKREREEPDESTSIVASSKLEFKGNDDHGDDDGGERNKKPKRPRVVETVQDPSSTGIPPPNPPKLNLNTESKTKSNVSKEEKTMDNALERFKDSRGTGPRRRTEEGYLVFKEDELGIRDEGGDTPLCPFDCTCCF